MTTILDHIPTKLKRVASTNDGEFAGPCPWCGGKDRFRAWPATQRYWCRRCGKKGDTIDLLRDLKGMNFNEATALLDNIPNQVLQKTKRVYNPLSPPSSLWCNRAFDFARQSVDYLWSPKYKHVLAWLHKRGFTDTIIEKASLGFNPVERVENERLWGLNRGKHVFLDKGIVIPWFIRGQIWRLNIRRSSTPKYRGPAGFRNGLYLVDGIRPRRTVVLVEGEFDALSVVQATGVVAVATGTASGSRKPKWIARLSQASKVLVAFDNDEAGDAAAAYWLSVLPNAARLRPAGKDANEMLQQGEDFKSWIRSGLRA